MDEVDHHKKVSQTLFTVAGCVVIVAGMTAAKSILVPFLLAAFIAIISAQPLFWLKRKGCPTWLALLAVIIGVLLVTLAMAVLVGSSARDFTRDLPAYQEKLNNKTQQVLSWFDSIGVDVTALALNDIFNPGAAMKLAASLLNSLVNVLANSFLILMTVIFILLEASSFPKKLRTILGGPDSSLTNFEAFISNVNNYMAIKTLISLITGILIAVWLAILGVDYPLLWGLLAFALNYVPNIGSIIAAFPAVLLAIVQVGLAKAGLAAAGYIAVNVLMGSVIEPRFMGKGLGLSTLVVFLSLIFWGWILGPVGMILSVPLTITVKIALGSRKETRWLAVLLGPATVPQSVTEPPDESPAENE